MSNTMIEQLPKYKAYRDSGVEWLGHIPSTWQLRRFKYLLDEVNERSDSGKEELLSVSQYTGVTKKSDKVQNGELLTNAASLEGYKIVRKGYLVSNIMLAWNGSLGVSPYNGITSPAYSVYRFENQCLESYYHYLLRTEPYKAEFKRKSTGVIESRLRLYSDDFFDVIGLLPPYDEQISIATFLDKKTSQIDEAIAIKQKQIELLKERKQIIIQQAVTQGLNPDMPMKDSGVDWIGAIPEHWIVKRAKYLLDEINERSETGLEELLSVSHITGVTPRSEKNVTMFMAEDYTGSKLCHSGDLVINIMWAWMGALGVSDRTGIVSPSYGVFREQREGTFVPKYLEMLLKSTKYVEYYNKVSTGLHSSRLRFYGHMLFDMALGFPPYDEQTQIVEYISRECSQVDEAITVQAEQVSKLKEYKTTLINSAVTGKIKVTELV